MLILGWDLGPGCPRPQPTDDRFCAENSTAPLIEKTPSSLTFMCPNWRSCQNPNISPLLIKLDCSTRRSTLLSTPVRFLRCDRGAYSSLNTPIDHEPPATRARRKYARLRGRYRLPCGLLECSALDGRKRFMQHTDASKRYDRKNGRDSLCIHHRSRELNPGT